MNVRSLFVVATTTSSIDDDANGEKKCNVEGQRHRTPRWQRERRAMCRKLWFEVPTNVVVWLLRLMLWEFVGRE